MLMNILILDTKIMMPFLGGYVFSLPRSESQKFDCSYRVTYTIRRTWRKEHIPVTVCYLDFNFFACVWSGSVGQGRVDLAFGARNEKSKKSYCCTYTGMTCISQAICNVIVIKLKLLVNISD